MRRLLAVLAVLAFAAALAAPSAGAVEGFGLTGLDFGFTGDAAGTPEMQAGSHPFALTTEINVNTETDEGLELPIGAVKDLNILAPPGLLVDPGAVPRCPSITFIEAASGNGTCPPETIVGRTDVVVGEGHQPAQPISVPIFNLTPPPGALLKLGFLPANAPVTLEAGLSTSPPYNGEVKVTNITQGVRFYASSTFLWGNPSAPIHDGERCGKAAGQCAKDTSVETPERAFVTLPGSCPGPLTMQFEADSWQNPGAWLHYSAQTHDGSNPPNPLGPSGCGQLGFAPRIEAQPTSESADSPSGLDFNVDVDDEGLTSPAGLAQSEAKKVVVTLPEGVTANPSLAEGLAVCSEAQLAAETLASQPGEGCPNASKIGTLEVESPLLEGVILHGQVFIATPHENPFGTLLALYMVIRDPQTGILVKLPAKVEPDPSTGQLVTTVGEAPFEIPQVPFSHFRFHLREGGRSPLITPPGCGNFTADALFTPWADPSRPLNTTAGFEISHGPGGGPCPTGGTLPFEPGFEAGSANNAAGTYSPFDIRLTRRDGDQDLTKLSVKLPPGLTAKFAGTQQCSDADIAAARGKTGKAEQASPSCPPNSRIGSVTGGAGVGAQLTYVDGSLYLAGPYHGAPVSVVAIVPAVAGPFDVGTVVTRFALQVDPRTAQGTVDGAASDPLPHILAGIPLRVRDIRSSTDRPEFTLNPTSCDPFEIGAQIWGGGSNVFSSLDDSPVSREARYQAASCSSLGFKPHLLLKLKGATKRGRFPSLHLVYRPRPGDANLSRLSLRFPRSEFIEQGHIRTICTRVQFAAGGGHGEQCPAASVYGRARVFTPILDGPLTGPIFLRSSSHNLPDVVLALRGPPSLPVDFEVDTRIDSVHGGLRAIADGTPDAPVSKAIVDMQGGQKGLLVNSTDLCLRKHRANVALDAQNGDHLSLRPLVRPSCAKQRGHSRHRRR